MKLFSMAWAAICLAYYSAARANLERRAPLHPDLLEVVLLHDAAKARARSLKVIP